MRLQKQRNSFQPAGSSENKSENWTDTHKDNGIIELLGNWPENQKKPFLSTESPFTLWLREGALILMNSQVSNKSTSGKRRTLQLHDFLITGYHSFKVQAAVFAESKFLNGRRKQISAWRTENQRHSQWKAFLLRDPEQNFCFFDQNNAFFTVIDNRFFHLTISRNYDFTELWGRKLVESFHETSKQKPWKNEMEHVQYCTGEPYFGLWSDDLMDVIRSVVWQDFWKTPSELSVQVKIYKAKNNQEADLRYSADFQFWSKRFLSASGFLQRKFYFCRGKKKN